jgi:hypothetical protein
LQDLHSFVTDPTLTKLAVRDLLLRDRHDRSITQRGEGSEDPLDVVRDQLNDDIDVFCEPQIPVRADRQSPGDQISDASRFGASKLASFMS